MIRIQKGIHTIIRLKSQVILSGIGKKRRKLSQCAFGQALVLFPVWLRNLLKFVAIR